MRYIASMIGIFVFTVALLSAVAFATEETNPGLIVASPDKYDGKNVSITVDFEEILNVFAPWEEEVNIKQSNKIKFSATPLGEINCYADRTPQNEEFLGTLSPEQKVALTGFLKKGKEVEDQEIYFFMVDKIEMGKEASPTGSPREDKLTEEMN